MVDVILKNVGNQKLEGTFKTLFCDNMPR